MEDLIKRILERLHSAINVHDRSASNLYWHQVRRDKVLAEIRALRHAESIIMDEYNKAKED